LDRRLEVAESVRAILQKLPEVASVSLKGSLQSGLCDIFSDIDIVVDVSGSNDAVFARSVHRTIESAFDLHFYDWAPSLLPEKYVQTFYMRDLPIFWNLDIEVVATPHYATLSRKDIDRDPTTAHLKLWALNTKYFLRGREGVDGEIAELFHRVLGKPAPINYTGDRMLLVIIAHLRDTTHDRYRDFIAKCQEAWEQHFDDCEGSEGDFC
jgi:predicted nucleotidyltransferase